MISNESSNGSGRDDPTAAIRLARELRAACLGLARFPDRFARVPRFEKYGIRHRVHGNYLIFYRVDAERVIVIHILHGAMDYSALLFPQ